jgi:uncharacterized phage protein (TIGR02220 family)
MTEDQRKDIDYLTSDGDYIYGWTQMDNGVIYCKDITDSEFRTYSVVRSLVHQYKKVAWPSVETIAELSGHSSRTAQRNIAKLVDLDLIKKIQRTGMSNNYMVNKLQNSKLRNEKDIQEWMELHSPKQPEEQKPQDGSDIEQHDKEKKKSDPIPYKYVIEHLNAQAGTKFNHTGSANQKLIKARWNEMAKTGLDASEITKEFEHVIDVKVAQWKDSDMAQYLRPSTLFGNKFDQYRNEQPNKKTIAQTGQTSKDDWKQKFLEGDDE